MRSLLVRKRGGDRLALVDDADAERFSGWGWQLHPNGYAVAHVPGTGKVGKRELMHRAILGLKPGDGLEVDHINGDRLDNRRANLRIIGRGANLQNRRGGWGASGIRGVYPTRTSGRWRAQAQLDGRAYHLGCFDSQDEAARIVSAWRREHMPYSEADKP